MKYTINEDQLPQINDKEYYKWYSKSWIQDGVRVGLEPNLKILKLSVKEPWFSLMYSNEKPYELREKGKWIESRLFYKEGNKRKYDLVEFTNGYGGHRPCFISEFYGFIDVPSEYQIFKNGTILDWDKPSYKIDFGVPLFSWNINTKI